MHTNIVYRALAQAGSGGEVSANLGVPPGIAQGLSPVWQTPALDRIGGQARDKMRSAALAKHNHWPCPEGHAARGLAHIVQERRRQQLRVALATRLQASTDTQRVALVGGRHACEQAERGRWQVFRHLLTFPRG